MLQCKKLIYKEYDEVVTNVTNFRAVIFISPKSRKKSPLKRAN
jgi:hypothetical protein